MKNEFRLNGQDCIIETRTPKHGLVEFRIDAEDLQRARMFQWVPKKNSAGKFYARAVIRSYTDGEIKNCGIALHRLITSFRDGIIDHIDRDPRNNTKANLRSATPSENCHNRAPNSRSATGFKGVYFSKQHGKYKAYIGVNSKIIHLGYFKTATDAALSYNLAASKYHGEFAFLNEATA